MMVAESSASRRTHSILMYDRNIIFVDILLFGCHTVKLFKQHTRLLPKNFDYSCGVLTPSLSRKDTNFRSSIPLRNQIALSFDRLKIIVLSQRTMQSSSPRHNPSNFLSQILHLFPRPSHSFSEVFFEILTLFFFGVGGVTIRTSSSPISSLAFLFKFLVPMSIINGGGRGI